MDDNIKLLVEEEQKKRKMQELKKKNKRLANERKDANIVQLKSSNLARLKREKYKKEKGHNKQLARDEKALKRYKRIN